MGITKEEWLRIQHEDPKNWVTKTCTHCKEKFKVNKITKPMRDEELGWCDECYTKIILKE